MPLTRQRVVAITGGTGFIGSRLVRRHLNKGDAVRILTRRGSRQCEILAGTQLFYGDIVNDTDVLRRFARGADILYHCAAEIYDSTNMNAVTLTGTKNLFMAANGNIGHWVQLSSVAIYGVQPAYATTLSKLNAENILTSSIRKSEFTYSILRPCKVYGKEMRSSSLRNLVSLIERGLFFFIGQAGAQANYVHVENVVEALYLCGTMQNAHGRAFNLSEGVSLERFVGEIAKARGVKMPSLRIPRRPVDLLVNVCAHLIPQFQNTSATLAGLLSRTQYNSDAIQQSLDYEAIVSLSEGIQDLMG
jgi:nucleoside-diphosphate-sugar epimerase